MGEHGLLEVWVMRESTVLKGVTSIVEAVTSPIKQSKNGQSKNTTSDHAITAHEAVKICPEKMTARRSSQCEIFLTSSLSISYHTLY
jgi:hypothetical protein